MRRRPEPLPPGFVPLKGMRFKRRPGRPYVPDAVERVRALVEGTTLPQAGIAARTGVGVATVHAWIHRRRWTRPFDASISTRRVGIERAGLTRRLRDALRRVEALARREGERLAGEAKPDGAALDRAEALRAAAEAAFRQRAGRSQAGRHSRAG